MNSVKSHQSGNAELGIIGIHSPINFAINFSWGEKGKSFSGDSTREDKLSICIVINHFYRSKRSMKMAASRYIVSIE